MERNKRSKKIQKEESYVKEITKEELMQMRISGSKKTTVIKVEDKFYITDLPSYKINTLFCVKNSSISHLCGKGRTCTNFNATKNGCPLIKAATSESLHKSKIITEADLEKVDCIENFDFIKFGYEIFNNQFNNRVVVLKCDNFKEET